MKNIATILAIIYCAALPVHAAAIEPGTKLPTDVVNFKERRDLCDHFRGEAPYDEERNKFLIENLEKYCTGTDRDLAALKAKYLDNPDVMRVLDGYEDKIEATSF